jgi:plastocyanin
MKRPVIFCTLALLAFGMLTLLIACGQSQASAPQYTPQTRDFTMVTVPLLVKESAATFGFLQKDFAKGGVLADKEVYAFSPDHLTVYQGDTVNLTIVNPEDDDHNFTLSDFNVAVALPPQAVTKVSFVANKVGVFTFYCNIAMHVPFMNGQLTVLPDSDATS